MKIRRSARLLERGSWRRWAVREEEAARMMAELKGNVYEKLDVGGNGGGADDGVRPVRNDADR